MAIWLALYPWLTCGAPPATLEGVPGVLTEKRNLHIIWEVEPTEDHEPTLRWLEEQGWAWAIEVSPFIEEPTLRDLKHRGWQGVVHMHAHPETLEEHWTYSSRFRDVDVPSLDEVMERHLNVFGDETVAMYFIEDDSSGVGFSGEYLRKDPKTHGEAFSLFERYMEEAMAVTRKYPQASRFGLIGYAPTAHSYARHGVECIIAERTNDDIEDLQTAVAFCRGAAKQFGRQWGIDFSLWWGVFYGCVHELPASLYKRHMYISHFSGAQAYRVEGGGFILGDPANPLPIAAEIDRFATTMQYVDPGVPQAPAAVMMAPDHGWMTPPYWRTDNTAWNYARIPYRQGQRGIDGFFGLAYPGHVYAMDPFPFGAYASDDTPASPYALSCITPDFAPTPEDEYYAEPPIPFGRFPDRETARAHIRGERMDPSPYRAMGDSRWGDVFDVFTTEAETSVLADYPVLVLLGQVEVDDALARKLTAYVEQGGTLVWAAGVATPDHGALTGLDITPELAVGRAWRWRGEEAFEHNAFRYLPAKPREDADTEVLAHAASGSPLVARHAVGQGRVVTCLIPWYEGGHENLASAATRMFDEVIGAVQPVRVSGLPLEWLSTRGDDHFTIVAANHGGQEWQGVLTATPQALPWPEGAAKTPCVELLSGTPADYELGPEGIALRTRIPAYDVKVFRWRTPQP